MKIKRILLTGDDGYKAIGIRVLVHYLKDHFDLTIAATRGQMSAVGGHVSLKDGCDWGKDTVDGVPALWIDGYPCDAVELAQGIYPAPFDLVISGINLGMNIGEEIISSGTYSAAIRALAIKTAKRAMVMSWLCPSSFWTKKHNGDEDIGEYLKHPGKAAYGIFHKSIEHDMWGAEILNINFPAIPSGRVRFTRGVPDLKLFFNYPADIDHEKHHFSYLTKPFREDTKGRLEWDTGALLSGYISVSPHRIANLDTDVYEKMKDVELSV